MMILVAALNLAQSSSALPDSPSKELEVPQTQLKLEESSTPAPVPTARIQLTFHNWSPRSYQPDSLLSETSPVNAKSFPGLMIGIRFEGKDDSPKSFNIRPTISFSYRQFYREALLSSQNRLIDESIPYFALGVGGEMSSSHVSTQYIRPYLGLLARTHVFIFPSSAIGLSKTRMGYSGQIITGIEALPWSTLSLGIDIGIQYDLGQINGQINNDSLQGWGLHGGVRWSF